MFERLASMSDSLLILLLGAVVALIYCMIMKRIAKKKRLYDERQDFVNVQGKAASWNITSVVLWLAWVFTLFYEGVSFTFVLIGVIYAIHFLSLMFTTMYYNKKN